MYFSIIIPTYNPKIFLPRMLESITHNRCASDIEVIISDDCSDEDFTDVVNQYSDKLTIVCTKNKEHYGAPLMGRQNGADVATGKWICFADQDDYWLTSAFDLVKEKIEEDNCKNYLVTDFYIEHLDGSTEEIIQAGNWTHGKFYEKKFWDEYKVSYPENIRYCEDIALSVNVNCILYDNNLERFYYPCFTYAWIEREDSLSKANGLADDSYFFKSIPEYTKGTLGQYIAKMQKDDYYLINIIDMYFHFYFYFQGLMCAGDEIPDSYYDLLAQYLDKFLAEFEISLDGLKQLVRDSCVYQYNMTRSVCCKQIPFIEQQLFDDFMDDINLRR